MIPLPALSFIGFTLWAIFQPTRKVVSNPIKKQKTMSPKAAYKMLKDIDDLPKTEIKKRLAGEAGQLLINTINKYGIRNIKRPTLMSGTNRQIFMSILWNAKDEE